MKKLILSTLLFALALTGTAQAGVNEGITCIKKNTYRTAEYDKGRTGPIISTRILVGQSYKGGSCMGRCGASCGRWWIASAWTKDCLDHDICIADQNGQNNLSNDTNCGDEFDQAADDYVFGVIRGCRG